MRRLLIAVFIAAVAGGGANACSATITENRAPGIGSEGGTIQGPDGSSINVPAGALTSKAAVSIAVAQAGTYPELPFTPLGKVYAFLPHGLAFATPVTATLPAPATTGPFDVWHAEQGGTWMKLMTTVADEGKLTFRVSKFSFFAVGPSTAPPDACLGARRPPLRPASAGSGSSKWFAANAIKLGLTLPGTNTFDTTAWEKYGYDLDDRCTSRDDSRMSRNTCKRLEGSPTGVLRDGALGVDNNFGQHVMSVIRSLKADAEEQGNGEIATGKRTLLLRLDNVGPDDNSKVPGALYLAGAMSGAMPPTFTTADRWPVDTRSLTDGATIAQPISSFPNGYMAGGVWVSGDVSSTGTALVEVPVGDVSLSLKLNGALISVRVADGSAGTIAGGVNPTMLEEAFLPVAKSFAICPGNATYEQVVSTLTQSADLVQGAPSMQDTTRTCNMISIGLGFTMKPTGTPTTTSPPPTPSPDPCAP